MKLSFYKRVVLLLCGLVLLVQLLDVSAVLTTIAHGAREQMHEDLTDASELIDQLVANRADLLRSSAELLAAELGTGASLLSQDAATILSALTYHVSHSEADLATYVSHDGRLVGASETLDADRPLYESLVKLTESNGSASTTQVLGGFARQIVSVPVKAPLTIGWLVLGSSLNDSLASAVADQVDMQVTFVTGASPYTFYGSSFAERMRWVLPVALEHVKESENGLVTRIENEDFLTHIVPVSISDDPVLAITYLPLGPAMASFQGVRQRLLSYMAVSMVVALVLSLWFARGVTRPVQSILNAAHRICEGDYRTRLDASIDSKRGDEIGDLVKAFDAMQRGIAQREEAISHHAYYDDLTNLPNRRFACDHLGKLIQTLDSESAIISVVLLSLNRHRQIVETLGFPVGEKMIQVLSSRLLAFKQQVDLIARVSVDEFLIVINSSGGRHPEWVAKSIVESLEGSVVLEDAELVSDVSAGIVFVPEHAVAVDDVMRRVSIALSDAKDSSQTLYSYQIGRDEDYRRRLSIVADLRRAVEQDELVLHYQPKINMRTMQVESVEALVRWVHPVHGFMPPDDFIGLAESSGSIGLLTHWVLDCVVRQLALWDEQGMMLKAAVNLSALDLQDESLFSRIQALLTEHDVFPGRLIIEVTESAMVRDAERAITVLKQFRDHGMMISIDDFGTGYSSLAKLKDLPIDELKIDRAFVSDIEAGTAKSMIIKAIIDLGHSLNLVVVSEGVETQTEWDLLTELGNDVVQGYLVSRPLKAEDFLAWWQITLPSEKRFAA